jgi:hypothetical protein
LCLILKGDVYNCVGEQVYVASCKNIIQDLHRKCLKCNTYVITLKQYVNKRVTVNAIRVLLVYRRKYLYSRITVIQDSIKHFVLCSDRVIDCIRWGVTYCDGKPQRLAL